MCWQKPDIIRKFKNDKTSDFRRKCRRIIPDIHGATDAHRRPWLEASERDRARPSSADHGGGSVVAMCCGSLWVLCDKKGDAECVSLWIFFFCLSRECHREIDGFSTSVAEDKAFLRVAVSNRPTGAPIRARPPAVRSDGRSRTKTTRVCPALAHDRAREERPTERASERNGEKCMRMCESVPRVCASLWRRRWRRRRRARRSNPLLRSRDCLARSSAVFRVHTGIVFRVWVWLDGGNDKEAQEGRGDGRELLVVVSVLRRATERRGFGTSEREIAQPGRPVREIERNATRRKRGADGVSWSLESKR